MKRMKKLLSILLVLCMVLSLAPASALAENATADVPEELTDVVAPQPELVAEPEPEPVSEPEPEPEPAPAPEEEITELPAPAQEPAETSIEDAAAGEAISDEIVSENGTRDAYAFTSQPDSGSYDPESKEYTVTWGTNFNPVRIDIQNNVNGSHTTIKSFTGDLETWGSYNIPDSTGAGTFRIIAFYGEGTSD